MNHYEFDSITAQNNFSFDFLLLLFVLSFWLEIMLMKTVATSLCIMLLIGITSCTSKSESKKSTSEKSKGQSSMEQDYDQRIAVIENNPDLTTMPSLSFNNNEGSTIKAVVHFDAQGNEVKIEEFYNDVATGNYGTNTFYFEKGRLFASKEVYHDSQRKEPTFVERISYYDSIPKVRYSKERTTFYEADLPNVQFKAVKAVACSFDRAMRALNEEGEFTTTFQGFIRNGDMEYILVGENSESGYVSSLSVTFVDNAIRQLRDNEVKSIGIPLAVEHQEAEDVSGMSYQLLSSIKILKK